MRAIDPPDYRGIAVAVARDFRRPGVEFADLVQEALVGAIRAHRGWDRLRPGEPVPSGYVAQGARNQLCAAFTRDRRFPTEPLADAALDSLVDTHAEPDTTIVDRMLASAGLTPREAESLRLCLGLDGNHGLSEAEAAKALGCRSVAATKQRALAKLRKALS